MLPVPGVKLGSVSHLQLTTGSPLGLAGGEYHQDVEGLEAGIGLTVAEATEMSRRNIPASSGRKGCIICSWR